MSALRNVSVGLAWAAWFCGCAAAFDAMRGAFDGGSAAAILLACLMGGFAAAGIYLTRGGDR